MAAPISMSTGGGGMSFLQAADSDLVQFAYQIADSIYPDDQVSARNPALIGIIIELLPIIADLLMKQCKPEVEQLVRETQRRGVWGRWNRRWLKRVVIRVHDRETYEDLGGWGLMDTFASICSKPENATMIQTVLNGEEAPEWGTLGTAV